MGKLIFILGQRVLQYIYLLYYSIKHNTAHFQIMSASVDVDRTIRLEELIELHN